MAEHESTDTPWEKTCPVCSGSGQIEPDSREEWLGTHRMLQEQRRKAAGLVEAAILDERLAIHAAQRPPGPEPGTCGSCGGHGVLLTMEGHRLLDFLHRRGPRTHEHGSR